VVANFHSLRRASCVYILTLPVLCSGNILWKLSFQGALNKVYSFYGYLSWSPCIAFLLYEGLLPTQRTDAVLIFLVHLWVWMNILKNSIFHQVIHYSSSFVPQSKRERMTMLHGHFLCLYTYVYVVASLYNAMPILMSTDFTIQSILINTQNHMFFIENRPVYHKMTVKMFNYHIQSMLRFI